MCTVYSVKDVIVYVRNKFVICNLYVFIFLIPEIVFLKKVAVKAAGFKPGIFRL
jgi:hypothetical protein